MKEINLKVSTDETNLILEALGNMPFVRVYALVGKIQEQAATQLNLNGQQNKDAKLKITAAK